MGAVVVTGNVAEEKEDCPPDPKPPKPKPDKDCCEKSYTVVIHFH